MKVWNLIPCIRMLHLKIKRNIPEKLSLKIKKYDN